MEDNSLITCYICETVLKPIAGFGPYRRHNDNPQLNNILRIEFSGWYGEYIDGTKAIKICAGCADNLARTLPWVQKALDEAEF